MATRRSLHLPPGKPLPVAASVVVPARVNERESVADFVEEAVRAYVSHQREEWEKQSKTMDESRRNMLLDLHVEAASGAADSFARTIRSALFVSSWSEFESDLELLAEAVANATEISLVPTDLKGKGVRRSKDFFKKVLKTPFPDTSAAWGTALMLNEVRNIIVHGGGRVLAEHRGVNALCSQWNSISVEDGHVSLDGEFVRHVLQTLRVFWDDLIKGLPSDALVKPEA